MPKLTSWARKCGQSTPKVRAIWATCPPSAPAADSSSNAVMVVPPPGRPCGASPGQEQRVEDDGLREGDGQDRLHEDLGGGARIAAHGGGGGRPDQADADGGAEGGQTDMAATHHGCP